MVPSASNAYGAETLDPLPPVLQRGLKAVATLGFLSFFSSISLFGYLTFKFVTWHIRGRARNGYNQFLLLVYNLVISDIQQSLAFLLTSRWLSENKIHVGTSICWAEGWFVSTGDLASSVWIFAIGIHTYLALIVGYKPPYHVFFGIMAGLWVFIYGMAIIGVAAHSDLYTRAGAWCWINQKYAQERLWLHYFWIFICMFGTVAIYSTMFIILRRRVTMFRASNSSMTALAASQASNPQATARAARYMIIYPAAYVCCTLPLAAGRAAAMAGRPIPYAYYCLSGAAITSNGWIDFILYALTRRALVFSDSPSLINEADMDTFGIYPHSQQWGTSTYIEGGVLSKSSKPKNRDHDHARKINSRSGSMDDLFGNAVSGAVVTKTTVKVETSDHPGSNESIGMEVIKPRGSTGKQELDSESWLDGSLHKD